ncbi:hypothetical protein ACM3BL_11740 [Mammaliicoccus sciuri]
MSSSDLDDTLSVSTLEIVFVTVASTVGVSTAGVSSTLAGCTASTVLTAGSAVSVVSSVLVPSLATSVDSAFDCCAFSAVSTLAVSGATVST